jgi:hypothetical protein
MANQRALREELILSKTIRRGVGVRREPESRGGRGAVALPSLETVKRGSFLGLRGGVGSSRAHSPLRKERMMVTACSGCSSMIQWPESSITAARTSAAAKPISVARRAP